MHILLFDTPARTKLFPLTLTKAIADIRFGIFSIKERWQKHTGLSASILTAPYLQPLYPALSAGEYFLIDASVLPTKELIDAIEKLSNTQAISDDLGLVAARITFEQVPEFNFDFQNLVKEKISDYKVKRLEHLSQIFKLNAELISEDFSYATKGKSCTSNYETVQFMNASKIFIEDGASISFSILNASDGPIYIGKNATIMEGCLIRGPFVLGEGATLKMGTKIYGGTSIGPYCVAGGEIKNSILSDYTNKAHDGYLGDSIIGEWCNLGAGTSNSNVKNTGGDIKMQDYFKDDYVNVGNKAGVIMGDYSRTAINTSINTGSTIGVCSNVFGAGFTPKVIPNFTWGTGSACKYEFYKAIKDIINWKAMKGVELSAEEKQVLKDIFDNHIS
jgi:UDP-N-acetylglucosamine diphosphorylase/glucosamine-1-phosphate N-acetyltransferase